MRMHFWRATLQAANERTRAAMRRHIGSFNATCVHDLRARADGQVTGSPPQGLSLLPSRMPPA